MAPSDLTLEQWPLDRLIDYARNPRKNDHAVELYDNFVVVVAMSLKLDRSLEANFVACYQADNSIGKIRTSPVWSRATCLRLLGGTP
ncbi:hypothetical protein [Accumulibacter sp.]|uniref:hypothetical protein n=1 Tax=Accumulibacter sp. TaxID=2053492 RepID=UPI0028C3E09F|nr:hypothetical protein [Accumulibacter sp.]